jgi:hypothetical protein
MSAVNIENGNKVWRQSAGQRHRTDGPAVEFSNGGKEWWIHGQRHRTDGPAVEFAIYGIRSWWVNGSRHRTDGPAIEWDGVAEEWWVHNRISSKQEISHQSSQVYLKTLLLTRAINPFCEVTVAKYSS